MVDLMKKLEIGRVESSQRWVRVKHGNTTIAESTSPLLLVQFGRYVLPTYFFIEDEVEMSCLSNPIEKHGVRYWTVTINGEEIKDTAWTYIEPAEHLSTIKGHITFNWHTLNWYEEAEQVFVHARDPLKRVDVMASSRHVQIKVNGETIADTHQPYLLFETHLPTRYYISQDDVNMEYLEETSYVSACPYKGLARYWSITVGEVTLKNIVWSYPDPIIENPKIKDLLCFFNEKVDIYVNDKLQARPITPWA